MLSRLFVYMAVRACIYSYVITFMADCACLYGNMCLLLWQFVPVYIVICDCMYSRGVLLFYFLRLSRNCSHSCRICTLAMRMTA